MSCAVGNDAARDASKHTAAFIIRAAIAAVVPGTGGGRERASELEFLYRGVDGGIARVSKLEFLLRGVDRILMSRCSYFLAKFVILGAGVVGPR